MPINIENNMIDKLDDLIKYIYNSVTIDYVYTLENSVKTKYYNRKNICTGDYDAEGECTNDTYGTCDFDDVMTTTKKIHYKFNYHPDANFFYTDRILALNDKAMRTLCGKKFNKIFLKCSKKIIIKNIRGFNHDHRGSNHTKLHLDYPPQITIKPKNGKISFKKFVYACFRIKSHKFDFWYELYRGVDTVIITDKTIEVHVNFDHGS